MVLKHKLSLLVAGKHEAVKGQSEGDQQTKKGKEEGVHREQAEGLHDCPTNPRSIVRTDGLVRLLQGEPPQVQH